MFFESKRTTAAAATTTTMRARRPFSLERTHTIRPLNSRLNSARARLMISSLAITIGTTVYCLLSIALSLSLSFARFPELNVILFSMKYTLDPVGNTDAKEERGREQRDSR